MSASGKSDARLLALAVALGLTLFVGATFLLPNLGPNLRLFAIPSASMAPALAPGDLVLVSRFSYGLSRWSYDWLQLPIAGRWPDWRPRRGDVVALRAPGRDDVVYLKRVVAFAGETVEMRAGRLVIDGAVVGREPAPLTTPAGLGLTRRVDAWVESLPGGRRLRILETEGDSGPNDAFAETRVPAGHVFVLGDNRDNSVDSRQPVAQGGLGPIPVERLIGRALMGGKLRERP
ncbi:MAG: signal peptidase I [Methylobacteriaceae bacterium]|nr:signal peptidase I [Methylobacteriaceae bacterium]